MKLVLDNLPASLQPRRETLARCLEAIGRVRRVRAVYLFGSHARGEARPDSDVDLCIVADGSEQQTATATEFRRALWPLRPGLSFTLIPITPRRLEEKKTVGDHFFQTVLKEGVELVAED
jgi:predicted nucleotidyltransferase